MLATLAFVSALSLSPAQVGPLKIVNVRPTFGILGSPRPEGALLPGDIYFLSFDIDNLQSKDGKYIYGIGMEFLSAAGKTEFKREATKVEAVNTLGGNRLPAFAAAEVGTQTAAGKYTLKATVTDFLSGKSETLTKEFNVLPASFGLVRLHLTYLQAIPAPPQALVPGQSVLVNCSIVNFQRDPKTKQPSIAIEINIIDDATGKPTMPKPFEDEVTKDVTEAMVAIPLALPLDLNRAGKFTVVLKATDTLAKKEYKVSLPLNVMELK